MKRPPLLAISIGCPSGIGPEVSLAAAAASPHRVLLVGDRATIERAAGRRGVETFVEVDGPASAAKLPVGAIGLWTSATRLTKRAAPGKPDREAGAAQLAWIDEATDLVRQGVADALVTGPVSKHAIASSGARGASKFLGHTEHLAHRLGAREVVMAFWADKLVTSLVTTHLPIAKVPRAITKESVAVSAYWLARLLEAVGARRPTIAVASLNPHAGEGGLLGREEIEQIAPGIEAARKRLGTDAVAASLVGPIGAETAMRRAAKGELAGVVAMYHDQATIPSKLLAFGDAVNVTLGLPIVRTSVDHGTGYDIAWRGKADEKGMVAAMDLAARLVTAKRPPVELSARSASSSRSSRRSGA